MFRLLEFIVLFLLAYKLFGELFGSRGRLTKRQQTAQRPQQRTSIENDFTQKQNEHPHKSYDNAELIDYEEVK